jgi:hypothetical protein
MDLCFFPEGGRHEEHEKKEEHEGNNEKGE